MWRKYIKTHPAPKTVDTNYHIHKKNKGNADANTLSKTDGEINQTAEEDKVTNQVTEDEKTTNQIVGNENSNIIVDEKAIIEDEGKVEKQVNENK